VTPPLNADIHMNGNKKPFLKFRNGKNRPIKINMEIKMNILNLTDEQIEAIVESTMLGVDEELENLDETKLTKEQIEAILRSALKNPMA